MQKAILKQVLFLIFIALILVMLMGLLIFSSAKAAERLNLPSEPSFAERNPVSAIFENDDGDVSVTKRRNRAIGTGRYNRVEGFYAGMALNKSGDECAPPAGWSTRPVLFGHWGYAFKSKDFQYQVGLEQGLWSNNRLAFGGEYHRTMDSPDKWIISEHENTLAAFFLCEDFRDYYFSEGASGYVTQNIADAVKLTLAYRQDDWKSRNKATDWSLFGGHKRFRPNPLMAEGDVRSLAGKLVLDTRNSAKKTTRGLFVQMEGEYAGRSLKGDFDYSRFEADARWYWTLGSWEGIDFRFRGGTAYGTLPWQKTYHLGGIGTLRGFRYKTFPAGPDSSGGNRVALFQVEYRMGREDFPFGFDFGFLEQFNLIFFSDLGWVGSANPNKDLWEGFGGLSFKTMKNDVGVALANRSGSMRVELARRTDTGKKPFTVYFRIERPF